MTAEILFVTEKLRMDVVALLVLGVLVVGRLVTPKEVVSGFSTSASFPGPVGYLANVLVMGPGGCRFADYLKVGLLLVVTAVPLFWPF